MTDSEATTPLFSADETSILASVLDEIIPPTADGRLPGAGQLGLAEFVVEALRQTPELAAMVARGLAELDEQARACNAPGFTTLAREDKVRLLNNWGFVLPLMVHACAGYYRHARVINALGLEARPPHPKGYEMAPNDLSLLDAVRRRPRLYREC
jgi:hypothetical protein